MLAADKPHCYLQLVAEQLICRRDTEELASHESEQQSVGFDDNLKNRWLLAPLHDSALGNTPLLTDPRTF